MQLFNMVQVKILRNFLDELKTKNHKNSLVVAHIDIMIRRGAYTNTQYHIKETYKLKEYFDRLLGYNLYDLFPEIKDNL